MTPSHRSDDSGRSRSGQDRIKPRTGGSGSGAAGSGAPRAGERRTSTPWSDDRRSDAPRSGAPFSRDARSDDRRSDAPRSGAPFSRDARSDDRRSDAPRSGAPSSRDARSDDRRSDAPRSGAPRSDAPYSRAPGSGAPRVGNGTGRPSKFGAARKTAAKGAAKTGAARSGAPKGPRAFGGERFGSNLGPVKNRPTEQNRRPKNQGPYVDMHDPEGIRLQKVMASAGVASRRVCEDMIEEGRVEVDGQIITEVGLRVDPKKVAITVDGIRLQLDESQVYMVFNKPKGVVSTMDDPEGRPCISDYLKNRHGNERLFHVGRLDTATEGLLLLTNDGELANRLSHPKYEVPKTYMAQVRGPMGQGVGAQMREGIELEDGVASVDSFRLVDSTPGHILVEVVLHSGKNRIVRRLFDAVGYPVERLVRVQVGPIRMNDQRQGSIRVLGRQEVGHLLASVGL
ncbi:pseudouridine synthase [Paenarthrobacter sp. PH39-S1]|uniref:pseudouridine synthase n=1 Tax=Paenarthrobacter sp. PH39-S1 TaxID=3046204 RepID=UPI0024B9DB22|nr:pseudouridine synthase [Paenarthrobacter sp. PH39-S1]MDJ0356981.1 pseudouridine synthase [Paenarthrobacter sp. PH39-S1]